MKTRFLTLICALLLLVSLVSCTVTQTPAGQTTEPAGSASTDPTEEGTSSAQPSEPVAVRVYTLNGTTGFGMAKLMEDAANGAFPNVNYSIEVKTDPATEVLPALIKGEVDIAALPTNAASVVYNKTNGGVRILAINTLGCLYLVTTDGSTVASLADLAGKTVCVPAQNPTFLATHLLAANGLSESVTLDSSSYAQPADLRDAVAAGAVEIAILPEPMVTIAKATAAKNGKTVDVQLDLTAEWDQLPGEAGTLVQGCVVVRTAFLEEHPETVAEFLRAYKSSVEYVNSNTEEAAALIARYGIFANEAVAKNAIPRCNIAYLDGADMRAAMETYLGILFTVNPTAIGGALPGADFYYPAQ